MYSLYMHIFPNNKIYVGITTNVSKRWSYEGYYYNKYFRSAVAKYGWNNIQHIVLIDKLSKNWAEQLERDLIWRYKSNNRKFGYNITAGGEGTLGVKHSQETIDKIRKSNTGKIRSAEARRNMSLARKGKPSGRKGIPQSEATKIKIGNANRGHKHTDETKEKIRNFQKGSKHDWAAKPMSNETKQKISDSLKGRKHSNEHNRKVADANRGRKASNETRKKLSNSHKGYVMPESQKINIGKKSQLMWSTMTDEQYRERCRRIKQSVPKNCISVYCDNNLVGEFQSQRDCAEFLGICPAYLCRLLKNNLCYKQYTFKKKKK